MAGVPTVYTYGSNLNFNQFVKATEIDDLVDCGHIFRKSNHEPVRVRKIIFYSGKLNTDYCVVRDGNSGPTVAHLKPNDAAASIEQDYGQRGVFMSPSIDSAGSSFSLGHSLTFVLA